MLKKIKWFSIGVSLVYIAAGIFLVVCPNTAELVILNIIAFAAMAIGALSIIRYFTLPVQESVFRNGFLFGAILFSTGIIVLIFKENLLLVLPILMAIVIMISGFSKLQDCIDIKRLGGELNVLYLILAIISIVGGILLLAITFKDLHDFNIFLGVCFIFSGASDLFAALYLSAKVKSYEKNMEEATRDAFEKIVVPNADPTPVPPEAPKSPHPDNPDVPN